MTLFYLGIFATSVLVSFVLTRHIRNLAMVRGWVAGPGLDRHLHKRPLPRLGGVAIFLTFLFSCGLAWLVSWWHPRLNFWFSSSALLTILLPGSLIFLLGLYDDLHPVGPYVKFTVQVLAGGILFAGGLRILDLPVLFSGHHLSWFVGLPLTILWVLGVTNAFNLIDGLDGLAAGSALFSTLVVFVVALVSHYYFVSVMTLLLAGAILGFLRFNFNPATIFLGDCGSLFVGFMLSALALQGMQKSPTIVAVAIPVVSFGLPILETTLSVVRRLISGRPVFAGDREHIHHKLLQRGLSQRQVVMILYLVSAAFAMLSLFMLWPTGSTVGLVLAVLGIGIWIGVQHLNYLEFGELRRVAQRSLEQRLIFVNNLAIRRAVEELKVASDLGQLCRVLEAAFSSNDFDAFELRLLRLQDELAEIRDLQIVSADKPHFLWKKRGSHFTAEAIPGWTLTLDLVAANNRRRGSLTMYRLYDGRDLQLDMNLLTSLLPITLADALDRVLRQAVEIEVPAPQASAASQLAG
ncbi:MAG: undecaprenyl/decaprenyl-phosphate alpha-N-acetylglucosaminyl 1-phosphate transferase [Acidobacteriia bacterium]|nr:undecaprenyl/decaprenyl-phosphate alpha-N-acetylglucosaminyl 1-phosphate transferase [Terriglobia bacterium]